jgi:hypothetical protein
VGRDVLDGEWDRVVCVSVCVRVSICDLCDATRIKKGEAKCNNCAARPTMRGVTLADAADRHVTRVSRPQGRYSRI